MLLLKCFLVKNNGSCNEPDRWFGGEKADAVTDSSTQNTCNRRRKVSQKKDDGQAKDASSQQGIQGHDIRKSSELASEKCVQRIKP